MTTHVLAVLKAKREEVSSLIHDTERKLTKLRAAMANLDAAMAILSPEHPDYVSPRRGYYRTRYFERNELPRLARDALREAGRPLTLAEIASAAVAAKGLPESACGPTMEILGPVLAGLVRKGEAVKTGRTRGAKWAVTD